MARHEQDHTRQSERRVGPADRRSAKSDRRAFGHPAKKADGHPRPVQDIREELHDQRAVVINSGTRPAAALARKLSPRRR